MLTPSQLKSKYLLMPGTQQGTYTSVGSSNTQATVTAWRAPQTNKTLELGAPGYNADSTEWHVATATLSSITPKPGDTYTDSGSVKWTVNRAAEKSLGSYWALTCVKNR